MIKTRMLRVLGQIGYLWMLVPLMLAGPVVAKDDIVVDFGSIGLWTRMNDSSWKKLNNASPDQLVIGDVDGNGQ